MKLNFFGPLLYNSGYCSVNRNLVKTFIKSGVDVKILGKEPFKWGQSLPISQDEVQKLEELRTDVADGGAAVLSSATDPRTVDKGLFNANLFFWETAQLAPFFVQSQNEFDEVWVSCKEMIRIFKQSGVKRPIFHFPLGIDSGIFKPTEPLQFSQQGAFKFLTTDNFQPRKNLEMLIDAYLHTFNKNERVVLVIKTNFYYRTDRGPRKLTRDLIREHVEGKGDHPPILLNFEVLANSQMPKLYSACDCYVSASHGEGWGFPAMEAASCGLPVIYAKGFGLNEFLSSDYAFPVSATLGPIPPGPKSFFGMPEVYQFPGNKWLNPSFTELCEQMRYVFDNQNEARIKGDRARKVMKEKFTWEIAVKRMMSRLKKIEDNMQKKR